MKKTAVQAPPIPIATVPKLWPGDTVVCIGGGPSLTHADVQFCRDKARVIAIKEAGSSRYPHITPPAPWADVLYACDQKWWQHEKPTAMKFPGMKYALHPSSPFVNYDGVNVLRNTGQDGLELDPTGLRTGCNSGYQAINLAVHFGATRIVLLGYDMWAGPSGDNWFGYHPNHTKSPYPVFLEMFGTIVEPLKAAGVHVVNASRRTQLRAFPRVALEDAFV